MRSGGSLECFLVELGQFFTILGLCEKNLCYAMWGSLGHPQNDEKFSMFGMILFSMCQVKVNIDSRALHLSINRQRKKKNLEFQTSLQAGTRECNWRIYC